MIFFTTEGTETTEAGAALCGLCALCGENPLYLSRLAGFVRRGGL
jgi:hypothetical protein